MLRPALAFLGLGLVLGPHSPPADSRSVTTCAPAADVGPARNAGSANVVVVAEVVGMSDAGLELLKTAEGFVATPRWDRTQWSIGYGTRTDDPHEIITEARALQLVREQAASISGRIIAKSKVLLNQEQVDALTSFAYNVGESALLGSHKRQPSTLWTKIQAGEFEGAAAEFQRWNKAGGVALPGLTKRRHTEAGLFRRGTNRSSLHQSGGAAR